MHRPAGTLWPRQARQVSEKRLVYPTFSRGFPYWGEQAVPKKGCSVRHGLTEGRFTIPTQRRHRIPPTCRESTKDFQASNPVPTVSLDRRRPWFPAHPLLHRATEVPWTSLPRYSSKPDGYCGYLGAIIAFLSGYAPLAFRDTTPHPQGSGGKAYLVAALDRHVAVSS